MRIIFGLIGVVAGFLIIWKSEWFLQNFGRVDWAEEKLSGGSRLFYKLVGLAVIIIAFLYMGGFVEGILLWVFAPTLRK